MQESGLQWPDKWEDAWTRIKQVWGSKWNERAHLSRCTMKIPHDDLVMAVLIQKVVEADYSFVIHTVNPFTGNKEEIYAELVLGLGEALVANYPGRALGFTCAKGSHGLQILSFPSKLVGLYGGGLIFRSDSNGEDLVHYAGAGLYDSFMLPFPGKVSLDYSNEPLMWEAEFRTDLLVSIARIGEEIENAVGSPQDIEGAYSKGQYHVVQTRPQVGIE
jgi:alpha-glucan,water dikinase